MRTLPCSRHLGRLQLAALERAGQVCIPGDATWPSFRELGCVAHVDRVLEHVPEGHRRELRLLLSLLGLLPAPVHRRLLAAAARSATGRGPVARGLRRLDYGLRGLIVTLYFSGWAGPDFRGSTPPRTMGWPPSGLDDGDRRDTAPGPLDGGSDGGRPEDVAGHLRAPESVRGQGWRGTRCPGRDPADAPLPMRPDGGASPPEGG
jgi:hypothetical protein